MPDHRKIRDNKQLKMFGTLLHHPNLWHLNRRSVASAFSIGLFIAFVPLPFQMVLAAAVAIIIHANLPIAVSLVWLSNPLTMPVLFYLAYKAGAWVLGMPIQDITFELTIEWLITQLGAIWEPFLLGCLILGTLAALIGNLLIRTFWRMQVVKNWQSRQQARKHRHLR